MSRFRSPIHRPLRGGVFAVEDTSVQLFWRHADPGPIEVRVGDTRLTTPGLNGPGAVDIVGLAPGTTYDVAIVGSGLVHRTSVTTLPTPPGELLTRIGTLNDLHLGCGYFGYFTTIREHPKPPVVSSIRCSHAAVDAMHGWGIDHLVLKGDVVHRGTRDEWAEAGELVRRAQVPTDMMLGNHEVGKHRKRLDPLIEAEAIGAPIDSPVRVRDLPGVRLVLAETAVPGKHHGHVRAVAADVADAVAEADGPAIVMLHHNLMALPVATFLPRGVSSVEGTPMLRAIRAANPATIITSGHTHRHRRRWHDGMPVVEVGSPKDYPGTWCGYAVHAGGIRQVVRRVATPDTLRWTERCRKAAMGAWSWWSPGRLDDRCFTHRWPEP